MSSKLLRPLLIFLIVFLGLRLFIGSPEEESSSTDAILIQADNAVSVGKEVSLTIYNNSDKAISFENGCPEAHLILNQYVDGEWITKEPVLDCSSNTISALEPGESYVISYEDLSWKVFEEVGRYEFSLNLELDNREKSYLHELEITNPSAFRVFWRELFYKPILNILIFLIDILPGHNLGWAVILLTLLIKLALWIPNQKALKAQKDMQKIQPQIEALKLKYKDDQAMLAQKTMEIWKKHKVSPAGSCLPMLIQFPILIGLFYVVRDGLNTINPTLLYGSLKTFDPSSINSVFLGILDVTKINFVVLPIIVGGLQFFQMHLTLGKVKKENKAPTPSPLPGMNHVMKYGMPIMIAVFTATLPAVVGIYWGTSTLFGIFQQFLINRNKK